MSWLKKKAKETKERIKEDWKERKEAGEETRKATRKAYFIARKQHQISLAKKKALFESQQRERQLKVKYAPKPKTSYSDVLSLEPSSVMGTSYFAPKKTKVLPIIKPKKRKVKSKVKKKTSKYIIRGGVAYPTG